MSLTISYAKLASDRAPLFGYARGGLTHIIGWIACNELASFMRNARTHDAPFGGVSR